MYTNNYDVFMWLRIVVATDVSQSHTVCRGGGVYLLMSKTLQIVMIYICTLMTVHSQLGFVVITQLIKGIATVIL